MYKVLRLYRRDGLFPIVSAVKDRVYSSLIRKKYKYSSNILIGHTTTWLTGDYADIGANLQIGKRCRIEVIDKHNGFIYHPRLIIGDNVSINDDVHIGCVSKVVIGNDVLMAGKIYISDHNHGSYKGDSQSPPIEPPSHRPLGYAPVSIGNNVWIGEMVSVLPGVTIGDGCIVGANSVVSKDLPPYTICVGAPAKAIRKYDFSKNIWITV